MSKRDAALLVADILLAIGKIKTYTEGLDFDSFMADSKTVDYQLLWYVVQNDLPDLENKFLSIEI